MHYRELGDGELMCRYYLGDDRAFVRKRRTADHATLCRHCPPFMPAPVAGDSRAQALTSRQNAAGLQPSSGVAKTGASRPPGSPRMPQEAPLVGIIMGSRSDWETMRHAADMLARLDVPHEVRVVSAHRTPQRLYD